MAQFLVFEANGRPSRCHLCGRPSVAVVNVTANVGSGVPSVQTPASIFKPVCEIHNPFRNVVVPALKSGA